MFFCLGATAQETGFLPEFKVSENDLNNNIYPKDSLAKALVIYESGNSYLNHDYSSVITEYKKKIKILKTDSVDYATVKIFLYKDSKGLERVRDIQGKSYLKVNGEVEVHTLDKEHIFSSNYNEYYDLVTFVLPNARVGSVITYRYTLDSPFLYNFHNWKFQEYIPKVFSEYKTKIPANYNYNIKLLGPLKLDQNTSEVEKIDHGYAGTNENYIKSYYSIRNIPAFIEEDYMSSKHNYMSKLEYELMQINYYDGRVVNVTKSWKDADNSIKSTSLVRQMKKSSLVKGLLNENIVNEGNSLVKAKMIFEYVQNNYAWNNENLVFRDVSVKKLLKSKSGDVGSINSLLYSLLKENNFEVYPVLSSTRSNSFPTKLFPVISEFNYLLVKVIIGEQEYLLDASDEYVNFGQLPFRSLNSYGRQIDFKNGGDWVSLECNKSSMEYVDVSLKFMSDTVLRGSLKTAYSGYFALEKKTNYFPNPEEYKLRLEDDLHGFQVLSHKLNSKGVKDLTFKEEINIERGLSIDIEDELYLDPFFIKFFEKNPFKLQERTYPVDFGYKKSFFYRLSLDLGSFYKIGELPENYSLSLPERKAIITCSSKEMGNKVVVIFKVDFKESIYSPIMYEGLKQLMSKAVNSQLNSILLLSKN